MIVARRLYLRVVKIGKPLSLKVANTITTPNVPKSVPAKRSIKRCMIVLPISVRGAPLRLRRPCHGFLFLVSLIRLLLLEQGLVVLSCFSLSGRIVRLIKMVIVVLLEQVHLMRTSGTRTF